MTTPTREQVNVLDVYTQAFKERRAFDSHEFALLAVFAAGRAQGLDAAAAKVRAILADCEERDVDDPELEQVAQDIEQLKGKQ